MPKLKKTTGIESENNEEIINEVPFNPNDININIVPRTIGQLVDMLEYGEILVPKFQRLPNLWNIKKKSRFIESLMLNLPIPLFYFDEGDDKKWRVIDGLQRISTLEHFILGNKKRKDGISGKENSFKLEDLEFKKEFDDKTWEELPRDIQRRIQTNQVTINLIGKGTPDEVKYNIFSRINQGAIQLRAQEIRTALFQGFRVDFLKSLVSDKTPFGQAFLAATDNSIPTKRQEDLDFVTRFVSFYLISYKDYEPDMDSFLTKGTKQIPEDGNIQREIKDAFKRSMVLAYAIFGDNAFRKKKDFSDRRKPINKSLFEIVSVYFAQLTKEEENKILSKKDEFVNDFIDLQIDNKFLVAITSGTAAKERVKKRHLDFKRLLTKYKR